MTAWTPGPCGRNSHVFGEALRVASACSSGHVGICYGVHTCTDVTEGRLFHPLFSRLHDTCSQLGQVHGSQVHEVRTEPSVPSDPGGYCM